MYKKIVAYTGSRDSYSLKKIITVIKLSVVLLILGTSQLGAITHAQSITINKKKISLKDALNEISKQSGHNIFFHDNILLGQAPADVEIYNKPYEEALGELLSSRGLVYKVIGEDVIVSKPVTPSSGHTFSQQITLTGYVKDETGTPVVGASVRSKGTNIATNTDVNGAYSLKMAKLPQVIIYSSIGYKAQELLVKDDRQDVVLVQQIESLDEVVVDIGYGTVSRRDLTGSVVSIQSGEIAQSKVASFQEAIQGRVAGVKISSDSGEPGAGMNISIRGANTIYGGTTPLFVVDGVPYDANRQEVASATIGNEASANPLAAINPADIESVDILKDASATAIYGSRGANGVVIITTKSGKEGRASINYDGFVSLANKTRKLPVLSPEEWLDYRRIVSPNTLLFYEDTNKDGLYDERDKPRNLDSLPKNDWQDAILRTGITQSHNVSVSGKSQKTAFSGGLGYFNQGAIIRKNDYKRYTGRLKIDHEQTARLKLGLNLAVTYSDLDGASQSGGGDALFNGVVQNLVTTKPVEFYDPQWDRAGEFVSPLSMIDQAYKNISLLQNNINAYVNYELLEGLSLNISGGAILTSSKGKEFYGKKTSWGVGDRGMAAIQENRAYSIFNTSQLNYQKRFNDKHSLNAMAAFEVNQYAYEFFSVQKANFADESTGVNDLSKGNIYKGAGSYKDVNRRMSYFTRVNYTFNNRHLFTGTLRADGSDKFGKGNRFGIFPSLAYSWIVSEESFLKSQDLINNLKLRLSYGETGNERIPSYRYLAGLENGYYNGELGLAPASRANEELKWETTVQYNAGVDLGLLKDRINLTLDIYKKETRDMLLPAYVPGRTGYNVQWQNLGRVDNKGIELQLATTNIQNEHFQWKTAFNISTNKNTVIDIGNVGFIPVTIGGGWIQNVGRVSVGESIGTAYGYVFDGIYQMDEFTWQDNSDPSIPHYERDYVLKPGVTSVANVNVRPGSSRFKDLNGDGVIDLDHDRTTISRSVPKHFGGINNSFTYKNFDLSIFFEWSYGNEILNISRYPLEGGVFSSWMNIDKDFFENRWTPENPNNIYGDFSDLNQTATFNSSYYVEDASYLRLKNVMFGYQLPQKALQQLGIHNARIYLSGSNLITWTGYSGYDPEINSGNTLLPGVDRITYPRARTITFGVNLTF